MKAVRAVAFSIAFFAISSCAATVLPPLETWSDTISQWKNDVHATRGKPVDINTARSQITTLGNKINTYIEGLNVYFKEAAKLMDKYGIAYGLAFGKAKPKPLVAPAKLPVAAEEFKEDISMAKEIAKTLNSAEPMTYSGPPGHQAYSFFALGYKIREATMDPALQLQLKYYKAGSAAIEEITSKYKNDLDALEKFVNARNLWQDFVTRWGRGTNTYRGPSDIEAKQKSAILAQGPNPAH